METIIYPAWSYQAHKQPYTKEEYTVFIDDAFKAEFDYIKSQYMIFDLSDITQCKIGCHSVKFYIDIIEQLAVEKYNDKEIAVVIKY